MEGCLEGVKGGKGAHEHRKSPAAQFPLTHLLSIKYPATPHFLSPSGLFLSLLAWENTHKHPREKWDCRQTEDVRQAPFCSYLSVAGTHWARFRDREERATHLGSDQDGGPADRVS